MVDFLLVLGLVALLAGIGFMVYSLVDPEIRARAMRIYTLIAVVALGVVGTGLNKFRNSK